MLTEQILDGDSLLRKVQGVELHGLAKAELLITEEKFSAEYPGCPVPNPQALAGF